MKEKAEKRKAELEERLREVEAAKAALDNRVQEAVLKLQEDQRVGAQQIADWAAEASLALVPFGMNPIQVAEPPALIADALPVLSSAEPNPGGGAHPDMPPEPRPGHLTDARGRWSYRGDGGRRSGQRAGGR